MGDEKDTTVTLSTEPVHTLRHHLQCVDVEAGVGLVEEGGPELAEQLEAEGYDKYQRISA